MKALDMRHEYVPKIIWSYWHQGLEAAPKIVLTCSQSARERNPDWEYRLLDSKTVWDYLDGEELADIEGFPLSVQADRIRTALIRRYGGVWVDPTAYHWRGLSSWVPRVPKDGVFTLIHRRPDRIEYWFLAGHRDSFFFDKMLARHKAFFSAPRIHRSRGRMRSLRTFLEKAVNRHHYTAIWWTRFPLKYFPAYPYFIYCYLADSINKFYPDLPDFWTSGYFPSADGALEIFHEARKNDSEEAAQVERLVSAPGFPVSKFSYYLGKESFWDKLCDVLDSSAENKWV